MTRQCLTLLLLFPLVAQAAPVKLLLSVGNDVGAPTDFTLQHAQTDAQRFRDVFVELGGVSSEDAVLLLEPSADEVRQRLSELTARAAALVAAGKEVMLLVYVSSHAQAGTLHLGSSELPLSQLRSRVEAVPASVRLLVVDACTSGAATRFKGGTWAPPAQTVSLQPTHGTVVITSSGPAEPSQEWASLQGSLFTHHWLGALRGQADVDLDGRITLQEAYGYSYRQTVTRADQHPTFDFDLQGSGELVLTEPRRASCALAFSSAISGRFVIAREPDARFVLEFDKPAGETRRVAVPAGTYRVRQLGRSRTGVAVVELPWGGVKGLGEGDFSNSPEAVVALKGSYGSTSLALEGAVLGSSVAARGYAAAGGALLRFDLAGWWASVGFTVGGGSSELYAMLGVGAGLALYAGPVRFAVGGIARPFLVSQPSEQLSLKMEGGGHLSIELALPGLMFVGGGLEGLLRGGPETITLTWRGFLVVGFRL